VIETNHLPHLISLIVSDEFMQTLTKEQQEIIRQAADIAKDYAREKSDERIAGRIDIIEQSGTEVVTLDEQTMEAVREKCKPVYEKIEKTVDPKLVEAYQHVQ
jgi:TRAP-type C4-dicarboxylate transport system substrate-binding protein